jgi:hypothetical protein
MPMVGNMTLLINIVVIILSTKKVKKQNKCNCNATRYVQWQWAMGEMIRGY